MARYDQRIDSVVCCNENAYANSALLIDWINQILVHVLPPRPRLLALNAAKFHSTHEVLSTLHSHDILASLILPKCTGLVQPLDVSVNKPFKWLLRDILNLLHDFEAKNNRNLCEIPRTNMAAVAEQRILVTQAVGEAWDQFSRRYQGLVVETFRKLGLTLLIDSSCDDELSVKGIESCLLQIGDWNAGDWLENSDIYPLDEHDETSQAPVSRIGEGCEDLHMEFIDSE